MKRIGPGPITPREAEIVAKLCEILYTDQYHSEEKRILRDWIRAHSKAQEMKRQGYNVTGSFHPGRPQVIVVNGKGKRKPRG